MGEGGGEKRAPYRYAAILMASWSTGGVVSGVLDLDAPYVQSSSYRLRARFSYDRNPSEWYYGAGDSTLHYPKRPVGAKYRTSQFTTRLSVERDLAGGRVRVAGGLAASRIGVGDLTGDFRGAHGGWNNNARLGIAYDTRDQEPNPRSGMFHDLVFQVSSGLLGAEHPHTITSAATRFYYRPMRALDVILAARLGYAARLGQVPFFALNDLPLSDRYFSGLGGESTLRGYRQSRFIGPVTAYGNFEVRAVFAKGRLLGRSVEYMIVPFLDAGRVYDSVGETTLSGMKTSYGAGLRAGVSQAFVLSFDLGFSEEDSAMPYITIGQVF